MSVKLSLSFQERNIMEKKLLSRLFGPKEEEEEEEPL
jgi:hypothetical protein